MHIYLPVAENSASTLAVLGLGALVGFLSGLFGVGGGFLLTPLLIMLGIPPTIAAATSPNQIVAASCSGTCAHTRAGNVDFKLGLLTLAGSMVGGLGGVVLIKALRTLGEAGFAISLTYIVMLAGIGGLMFSDGLKQLRRGASEDKDSPPPRRSAFARALGRLPWPTHFPRSRITLSPLAPVLLGLAVGLPAAIMGVGGGFIMLPALIYVLTVPVHVAVGTTLFQTAVTCAVVTVLHASLNHTVDFVLALLLFPGSVVGAQLGARLSRLLRGEQLKLLLSLVILGVMVKMLLGVVLPPEIRVEYPSERRAGEQGESLLHATGETEVGVVLSVAPQTVDIGLAFNGARVAVRATLPEQGPVAVLLLGRERPLALNKIEKFARLLWKKGGTVVFASVPEAYLVQTSAALNELASPEQRAALGLGYEALREKACAQGATPDARELFGELVKLKEREGLFAVRQAQIALPTPNGRGRTLRAEFSLPACAPAGEYEIRLFGLRGGQLSLLGSQRIALRKTGAVRTISYLARERGLLYGIVAVALAALAGLAVGFIFRGHRRGERA